MYMFSGGGEGKQNRVTAQNYTREGELGGELCHQWNKKGVFFPEPFIYAPLHGMGTILRSRLFVVNHFCCSQECIHNRCFIQN